MAVPNRDNIVAKRVLCQWRQRRQVISPGKIMYAIISDGGRQYRVEEGQELDIDFRDSTKKGDEIAFESVLALSTGEDVQVGAPTLEGAKVTAEVVGIQQGPKLVIQKFRRRKNSRRRTGHRQMYTKVRINKIAAG